MIAERHNGIWKMFERDFAGIVWYEVPCTERRWQSLRSSVSPRSERTCPK